MDPAANRVLVLIANLREELANRNDEFGYGVFILFFFGICYLIGDAYNFGIASFIFLLLLTVLELSYRLSNK